MLAVIKGTLQVIGFVIGSWILVHVFGLLGVFLAVAYPIWWLIAPSKTICFGCQGSAEKNCRLCGSQAEKSGPPKNFRSAVLNGVLLLLVSIFSTGLIFVENFFLHRFNLISPQKTVSFVIPSQGQYRMEEIFPFAINISGIEVPVNAVQADLGFDPTRLEVVDVSTAGSFAEIFIQKEINNDGGYVRLTGGLPDPGFFSDRGLFGTIFFKAKAPGLTKIQFLPSSLVLANDGQGTNVIRELAEASYLILPEELTAKELKQQEALLLPLEKEADIDDQLTFYIEDQNLIAWTEQEIGDEIPRTQVLGHTTEERNAFIEFVHMIDQAIIDFWEKVGEVIADIF